MLLLVVITALLAFYIYRFYSNLSKYPPGPTPLPFIGNLLQLNRRAPQESFSKWAKLYGGVYTVHIPKLNVVIADYEVLKETIIKQGDVFTGRYHGLMNRLLTDGGNYGLVLSDGPIWKDQRRFVLHTLRDFGFGKNIMEPRILEATERMILPIQADINNSVDERVNIDMNVHLTEAVANIINGVTLGYYFERNDPKLFRLKKMLDENFKMVKQPALLLVDSYPWINKLPIPGHLGFDKFLSNVEAIREFILDEIRRHKLELEAGELTDIPTDFTAAYLIEMRRREKNGEDIGYFSEIQLACCLFDLWIAGMETTVTTLRWAFVYLLNDDEVLSKLYAEIDSVVGRDRQPNMTDRAKMPFTAAVIAETQRNCNLLPISLQRTSSHTVRLAGCDLAPGTLIIPQIGCVMKDEKYFKDPDRFDPTRFLDENSSFATCDEWIPFSIGKRKCLGESLARMELFLILVTLLQRFRFTVPVGSPNPSQKPVFMFTYQPEDCLVSVTTR